MISDRLQIQKPKFDPLAGWEAMLRERTKQFGEQMNPVKQAVQQVGEVVGDVVGGVQKSIIPTQAPITQTFNNYNPALYKGITKDMRNKGVDFGIKEGTPLSVPDGNWVVKEANTSNSFNRGYGNSILVENEDTGEKLRYSHLSNVNVLPGQKIRGGSLVGKSGATGNVTGPHLDLEFYDNRGQIGDVTKSRYGAQLFGAGGGPGDSNEVKASQNRQAVANAYNYIQSGANKSVQAMRDNPRQFDLGRSIQDGRVAGFLPNEVRQPVGSAINFMVPMDKILGGAAQGNPLDALTGGLGLLGTFAGVSALDRALVLRETLAKNATKKGATTKTVESSRDAIGRFAKKGTVKPPTESYGQMRQRILDTRPSHQQLLEEAANRGDWNNVGKILDSIPANDPYKSTMESLFRQYVTK